MKAGFAEMNPIGRHITGVLTDELIRPCRSLRPEHHYRPEKAGERFSTKLATPSRKSSDARLANTS